MANLGYGSWNLLAALAVIYISEIWKYLKVKRSKDETKMNFHETALAFLVSSRQFPDIDKNDSYFQDRLDLQVKLDSINLLDKSRKIFIISSFCIIWLYPLSQNSDCIISSFYILSSLSKFRLLQAWANVVTVQPNLRSVKT